jgi:hypothetical protein
MNQSNGESVCPFCGSVSEGYDEENIETTFVCGSGYSIGGPFQSSECVRFAAVVELGRVKKLLQELLTICPQIERAGGQYVEMMVPVDLLREIEQVTGVLTYARAVSMASGQDGKGVTA